jgi:hypothetical protein
MHIPGHHIELITRLKQQSRHGRAVTDPADLSIGAGWKALKTATTTLGASAATALASLKKLNKGAAEATGYEFLGSVIDGIGERFQAVVQGALDFEKRNKSLQESFGITATQAAKLGSKLDAIAHTYKISEDNVRKYAGAVKNLLPTLKQVDNSNTGYYKSLIKTQQILQTNLGLTEEQANKYSLYAQNFGQNGDEMLRATKAIADSIDPDGTVGAFKMITEEIATASEELTLQYGKIPGQLEAAVIKAKKFGFSLEQVKSTADGLLDIESSIGSELEYQLLSGRRLVDENGKSLTNTIREAAIRGDMATQADAMNKLIEQEGETLENNLFARKQMSQLLGMDEAQLASAIQKKKILDKASAKGLTINLEGSDAITQAAAALKAGAIDPAEFEKFSKSVDTRSTEDLLKESIAVQKAGLLLQTITNQEEIVRASKAGILGFDATGPTVGREGVTSAGQGKIAYDVATGAYKGVTELFDKVVNDPLVQATRSNDMVSFPGYGKRTLFAKEGAIHLNDNDMIVAGTNLFGGNNNTVTLAKAVVDAINHQTKQLLNQTYSGINAPYYG